MDDLVYAATARCLCGAGFAYRRSSNAEYWECSDILLESDQYGVVHTGRLSFASWGIVPEGDHRAHGATTRPRENISVNIQELEKMIRRVVSEEISRFFESKRRVEDEESE